MENHQNQLKSTIAALIKSSSSLFNKLLENPVSLIVNGCNYNEGHVEYSGEVYIEIDTGNLERTIEFTNCSFKDSSPEALFLYTTSTTFLHIKKCNFSSTSSIYFYNGTSAKIENCSFINMTQKAISYKSSATATSTSISKNYEFKIENCNFIQSDEIDCLVYFVSKISSQFYFLSNSINISNKKTTVFNCAEELKDSLGNEGWHFEENTIFPGRNLSIKSEIAQKIPASCNEGFTCILDLPECNEEIRCDFTKPTEELEIPLVTLTNLHFNGNLYNENGAAIHLKNYGIYCHDSTFETCTSEKGGGGIYIYLDIKIESQIKLEKLELKNCRAVYGGAVFCYSSIEENSIDIVKCKFIQNVANNSPSNVGDVYFGGSAVFMYAIKGKLIRCTFSKNSGTGVKIFNDNENSNLLLLSKENHYVENSISIDDCLFEASEESKASIFYVRGSKKEISVEVKNCVFEGKIADGFYHIDGQSLSKRNDPMNLHVKLCKFKNGEKSAFNMKSSSGLLLRTFEIDNNIFKYEDKKNSSFESKIIFIVGIITCAVVIFAFFIHFGMKIIQQNTNEESIEL